MDFEFEPTQALATFFDDWEEAGLGPDGLPLFKPVLKIRTAVPPNTENINVATAWDIARFPLPYQLYEKEHAAMGMSAASEGFPLVLWPACRIHQLKMLAARGIVTVEHLAKLADRGAPPGMPAELAELAARAKQMILLSEQLGKFEEILREREAKIAVLTEQVSEAQATIRAQEGTITQLKLQKVA